jgi:hypothetical protein
MDGLLIDYGGVLTTSVLASFDAFGPGVREAFRDGGARQPLIDLENGDISLESFEQRVASVLGTDSHNLASRSTHVSHERRTRSWLVTPSRSGCSSTMSGASSR